MWFTPNSRGLLLGHHRPAIQEGMYKRMTDARDDIPRRNDEHIARARSRHQLLLCFANAASRAHLARLTHGFMPFETAKPPRNMLRRENSACKAPLELAWNRFLGSSTYAFPGRYGELHTKKPDFPSRIQASEKAKVAPPLVCKFNSAWAIRDGESSSMTLKRSEGLLRLPLCTSVKKLL